MFGISAVRRASTVRVLIFVALTVPLVPLQVFAQQSVDYASISGRVTDSSGATVPGALVEARHTPTNVVGNVVTDQEGRFRFPYLRVGPYAITVKLSGFQDVSRPLTLTAGSAFELPIVLSVSGLEANVTVTGETTVLEAARSQIAATVAEAEVKSLPLNGRNFIELGLLGTWRVADQRRQRAALPGDIGRAGREPVGQQPAQSLEQLRGGRPVGE